MRFRQLLTLDRWSAASHKAPMRDDPRHKAEAAINGWTPHTWVGEEHRRRLTAYLVYASYDSNVSREFLEGSDDDRANRREYGDAGLVVDSITSALLGDEQSVVVVGAEHYDPELDDVAEPAEGQEPAEVDEEARAANEEARILSELQEFLQEWAEDVHLPLRMVDAERQAVLEGDTVYLLGWDADRERPTLAVMDPGFYFPVLPDTLDAYEYPERVHFAWELPGADFPDGKDRVRRITYDLHDLEPTLREGVTFEEATLDDWQLPDNATWGTETIGRGENAVTFPVPVRQYPWDDADAPSRKVCTVTDATWKLDDLNDASNLDAFDIAKATLRVTDDGELVEDLDLGIDFVPVVHVPNTPGGGEHYGQSSLARVLQVLDDLQNADTDAQAASATTGSPIIGVSGGGTLGGPNLLTGQAGRKVSVTPGEVWGLGENGRMDALDTSPQLAELRNYIQALRDRLLVNARLPAAVVGTVKPSEVPSGFAMQLSFGPLTSMIRTMRLVRDVKYPLLLKMVIRFYQANDLIDPGPTPRAEVQLGSFLPSDMAGVLEQVKTAYGSKLISLETAVTMLLEVGFPIDDIAEEIAAIEGRDFEGANAIVDLTGNPADGLDYLGRAPEQATEVPADADVPPGEPIAGGAGVGQPSPTDRA